MYGDSRGTERIWKFLEELFIRKDRRFEALVAKLAGLKRRHAALSLAPLFPLTYIHIIARTLSLSTHLEPQRPPPPAAMTSSKPAAAAKASSELSDLLAAELAKPYPLTSDQIAFYQKHGFIRLKNFFSPALLAHFLPSVEAAVSNSSGPIDEQLAKDAEDEAYARAFKQVINIWRGTDPASTEVARLAFSQRLASTAAALMAVSGIRIYHDQALFKYPGGSNATPYHADQFYWPLSSDKTVTAWIPLGPSGVPVDMGPLEFVARSHGVDMGRDKAIGAGSDAAVAAAVEAGGFVVIGGGFDPGEVSFHAGWTFHRAGPNTSDTEIRQIYTVIYMDHEMKMVTPINDNQRADAERYLQGVEVGGVCAGPANPLVWKEGEGKEEGADGAVA